MSYGMAWYVSKHKHKENLGTLGIVVERLEALWKCLNAFRALRERVGSFSRLGRLGSIKEYGMVWLIISSRKRTWERSGAA